MSKVIAPLNVVSTFRLVIDAVPEFPEAIEIGLAKLTAPSPLNFASAEPTESPMVMVPPFPKEAATLPLTMPVLMVTPVVNVFVEGVNDNV